MSKKDRRNLTREFHRNKRHRGRNSRHASPLSAIYPSSRGFLETEGAIIILQVCRVTRSMRSNARLLLNRGQHKNAFYVTRPGCSRRHFIFRPFVFLGAATTFYSDDVAPINN